MLNTFFEGGEEFCRGALPPGYGLPRFKICGAKYIFRGERLFLLYVENKFSNPKA